MPARIPPRRKDRKPNPSKLDNLLLYFHDIDDSSYTRELNGKLVLTNDDDPRNPDLLGFVLNDTMPERLGRFMRRKNLPLSEKFNFVQFFDAGTENFEYSMQKNIGFLMRKTNEPNPYPVFSFGQFEALVTESYEEAQHVSENLAGRDDVIVFHSELFIARSTLMGLFNMGKVEWREADPDIVFNPSAYMRLQKAFPDFAPKF